MTNVKVLGAGSIGNHLSNAARTLGWNVTIVDPDPAALKRTKEDIYPGRYGTWDDSISLCLPGKAPVGGFDFIFIGTPPDSHMKLAIDALDEQPKAVLVEKPVCPPSLEGAQELWEKSNNMNIPVFVGFDHVVGVAAAEAENLISSNMLATVETIDVDFREYWGGIFAAHPWLDGPADTYLGYWQRGGGASSEHSHAINLWQHFAHIAGAGRITEVRAEMSFFRDSQVDYDKLCLMTLKTESGLIGRVAQDVVTSPPRKMVRIQGQGGFLEWHCGFEPGCDAVISSAAGTDPAIQRFVKTRPEDFIQELRHIEDKLASGANNSPISLERGLDSALAVAAAHQSVSNKCAIAIDYSKGYTAKALISAKAPNA